MSDDFMLRIVRGLRCVSREARRFYASSLGSWRRAPVLDQRLCGLELVEPHGLAESDTERTLICGRQAGERKTTQLGRSCCSDDRCGITGCKGPEAQLESDPVGSPPVSIDTLPGPPRPPHPRSPPPLPLQRLGCLLASPSHPAPYPGGLLAGFTSVDRLRR